MYDDTPHSFDTRGFRFALTSLFVLVLIFSAVRYGTVLASDAILASQLRTLSEAELQLEEKDAARKAQPAGAAQAWKHLRQYEDTLATRTIGTASVEAIALAHERLIAADLSAMRLYLFEDGLATASFDILSKGERGSRWETPTGLYEIETKAEDYFYSTDKVHMPYSMQFFGTFFIHGRPFYLGDEEVPKGFSGGGITLSRDDAREVFAFAQEGLPLFIWEDNASSTPFSVGSKSPPTLSATAFLVANIQSGEVYAEKNADEALPIASLSKLLTALVANETIHFDRMLAITKDDRQQTDGTPGSLTQGDMFTIGDLLYPLLMESNNSASYSLARYTGTDNFVRWMNDKAQAIGMTKTHIDEPSGLSAGNVASADDLFVLTKYIYDSQSFILNVSRETKKTIQAENGHTYALANFNHFAGTKEFLGGKVGYTDEARQTMTAVFEIPVEDTTATIAIIVLGSTDRKNDVQRLRSWFESAARVVAE